MMVSRFNLANPVDYAANVFQVSYMIAEAQSVIAMRMLGGVGIWSVSPSEDNRMISEKVHALTKACTDSAKVALNGGTPDAIAAAAIKPIRQKTRANAKRLGKRGLKKG